MKTSDPPIVVEQSFDAPIDAVWRAISDPDQMRRWFFENIPAFEAEVGFETLFEVRNEDRVFPHRWKVTKVVPRRTLEYNWKFDGYPGDSFVTFDLFEVDGATRLRVTSRVVEDFPDGVPEFTRESCLGGWTYFITNSLEKFLKETR